MKRINIKVNGYWHPLDNVTVPDGTEEIKLEGMDEKCYCGKPVDYGNPDCVAFSLCEDHATDA